MFNRIVAVFLTLFLSFGVISCGNPDTQALGNSPNLTNNTTIKENTIPTGKYPVQKATFNDIDGEYTLMLLNTPPGGSPVFRTTNLQMARLTDEEIKNGEATYAEINGNEAVMHLTPDFPIEYIHNETEVVTNPNTGRQETVVVRQQSNFWTPFAGALAGQAVGNLLFSPRYYVPPVYSSGGNLQGFGGAGNSYNQAVRSYQNNYNSAPPVEKNRQSFRTTGTLKNSSGNTINRVGGNNTKSTGSGFGSSNLKTNNRNSRQITQPSRNSFGSNRNSGYRRAPSPSRSGGFGRRR